MALPPEPIRPEPADPTVPLSSGSGGVWSAALTRRLRSLLKTAPLHALRANEGRVAALREHDDTSALCMKAMEVLVDALGLRAGAARDEVVGALVPLLHAGDRVHDVVPDSQRHRDVADRVIGVLLNDAGRRQAYSADYVEFEGERPVRRTMRFRLASEQEAYDGSIVLRAETDGINLFLRSLDVELEDAQAAVEAVIRSQIQRGRLDLALQSAREAQIRSMQYQNKVVQLLQRTRRDVGQVDWRYEVPRLLQEALSHVEGRLRTEREVREVAQDALERIIGTPEAPQLVKICDMLDDCLGRHVHLQGPLIDAFSIFRDEQARQRFAPLPLNPFPALEADLLMPVLACTRDGAASVGSAFGCAVVPPFARPFLDLRSLWARLLRAPREATQPGREIEDQAALVPLQEAPPLFDEELTQRVDQRLASLDGPASLEELLATEPDPIAGRFLVLRALQHFAPEGQPPLPISVERARKEMHTTLFSGDALTVAPLVERASEGEALAPADARALSRELSDAPT